MIYVLNVTLLSVIQIRDEHRKLNVFLIYMKTGGADYENKNNFSMYRCKQRNYNTMKNKKNDPDRLEMKKYCKFCKKHTLHKETK